MRRRLMLAVVAAVLLAVIETAVFVAVLRGVGAGWAVSALLASSVAGVLLLRREGIRGWRRFRAAARDGQPPGPEVSNAVVGLLGAVLIALPGFITALVGLVLLLPPSRVLLLRGVQRATERRVTAAVAGELFGPRRVRVRRGAPVSPSGAGAVPNRPDEAGAGTVSTVKRGDLSTGGGAVVEGEIVDVPHCREQ